MSVIFQIITGKNILLKYIYQKFTILWSFSFTFDYLFYLYSVYSVVNMDVIIKGCIYHLLVAQYQFKLIFDLAFSSFFWNKLEMECMIIRLCSKRNKFHLLKIIKFDQVWLFFSDKNVFFSRKNVCILSCIPNFEMYWNWTIIFIRNPESY